MCEQEISDPRSRPFCYHHPCARQLIISDANPRKGATAPTARGWRVRRRWPTAGLGSAEDARRRIRRRARLVVFARQPHSEDPTVCVITSVPPQV